MIKKLSATLIFFIIFFGFFFRYSEDFTLFSPAKAAIGLSIILICVTKTDFWTVLSKPTINYILFLLLIFSSALLTLDSSVIEFYFFEVVAIFVIYISGNITSYKKIDFFNLILIASIVVGILGVKDLIDNPVNSFRRFALFGGYNYSASNFAIATTIALYKYFQKRSSLYIILVVILFSLTIIQGSRQAIAGLFLVALFLFYNRKKKLVLKLLLGFGILGVIGSIYLVQFGDITFYERFSSSHITETIEKRTGIWREAISGNVSIFSILFGNAETNTLIETKFVNVNLFNPHNLFLSTYKYHGVLATISIFLLISEVFINNRISLISKILFFLALFYLQFSGELTRSFHFIFILGYCHGNIYNNIQSVRGKRAKCK
ncbi:hypothetical protein N9Z51_00550 [bacterium]|nr:hypothetical protein [bacterium]